LTGRVALHLITEARLFREKTTGNNTDNRRVIARAAPPPREKLKVA
jgi:hypothetical protein